MQPPALDRAPDLLHGVVRDRWAEADEELAASAVREPGTERVTEEREPLMLMGALAV
jgi:hypothetical protein